MEQYSPGVRLLLALLALGFAFVAAWSFYLNLRAFGVVS